MLELLKSHFTRFLGLWAFGGLSAMLGLVFPEVTAHLTGILPSWDTAEGIPDISPPPIRLVLIPIGILLLALLAQSTVNYINTVFDFNLAERVLKTRKRNLFERVARFRPGFFRQYHVDTLLNRINEDDEQVQRLKINFWIHMPIAVITLMVYSVYLFQKNWLLAVCIIPLSLLSGLFLLFDKQIQKVVKQGREVYDQLTHAMREYLLGVEEVRHQGAFSFAQNRLGKSIDREWKASEDVVALQAKLSTLSPIVSGIQDGTLYIIGALLCIWTLKVGDAFGHPTPWGDVIAFMMVAAMFKRPVQEIFSQIMQWRMTKASMDRVSDLEREPLAFADSKKNAERWLQCPISMEDVGVDGDHGGPILRQISLSVSKGQNIALVGPSGCGKSTTLRVLLKEADTVSGEIQINELDLDQVNISDLACNCGIVPQEPYILNDTIRENLLLGLRRTGTRQIEDEHGVICLDAHPEVDNREALDLELVRVANSVALGPDLEAKALELPLGQCDFWKKKSLDFDKLRAELQETLSSELGEDAYRTFSPDAVFPEESIGFNLFYGLQMEGEDLTPTSYFLKICQGDQNLEEQINRLLEFLTKAVRTTPQILGSLQGTYASAAQEIHQAANGGKSKVQVGNKLAEATLTLTEAIPLQQFSASHPKNVDAIVQLRKALLATADNNPQARHVLSSSATGRMALRDRLIGGKVNKQVHGLQEKADRIIIKILERHGLGNQLKREGLSYKAGEEGKNLSGGQRQKVALARAFLKRPSLLLLDEATSALDEISQKRVIEQIHKEFTETTTLMIAQRLNTITEVDQIIVFDKGQIVQTGTYAELADRPGLFAELIGADKVAQPATSKSDAPSEPSAHKPEIWRALSSFPLFSNCANEQLQRIADSAQRQFCPVGTLLFEQGDAPEYFYLIESGQVDFLDHAGAVANSLDPGEVFGEIAIFSRETRTLSARAAADTSILLVEADDLKKLVREENEVACSLLKLISERASNDSRRARQKKSLQN